MAKLVAAIEWLWADPVWSKVIAAVIAAGVLGFIGWMGTIFNWWTTAFGRVMRFISNRYRLTPALRVVDVSISTPHPQQTLTYPLKCYVTLRNISTECADITLFEYLPLNGPIKDFPLNVLQLRFGEDWWPKPDGVGRIGVLPAQLCRAWIGLDERILSEAHANRFLLLGQLGTLVLSVNHQRVSIPLKPPSGRSR